MIPRRGHSRSSAFLDFYACFLLPAYTLLFAGSRAWLRTNFSVRAVLGEDFYRGFVLWGLLAGSYFFVMMTRLILTLPGWKLPALLHSMTLGACLALAYAIAIPYLPADFPRWADLHVVLAAGACVLLMAEILLLLLVLPARCRHLLWAWGGIVLGSGALFAIGGMVTTALEVFFTLSATLLLRKLWLIRTHSTT